MLANTPSSEISIDLVIFDCDGVLIDSEILSKQVLLLKLDKVGVSISCEYFDTYFLGHSYASVKAHILADYSVALSDEFRQEYLDSLLKIFSEKLTPTSELDAMLSKLKIPNCIATSSSPTRVEFALTTTGLLHFFEGRIFTAFEVKNGKPAPDLFLHAAEVCGVAPQNCLVIEDSQAGIKAAKAANMRVIKYSGASHLKDKGVSEIDQVNNVKTIFHWNQLFELFPSLAQVKQVLR